MSSPHSLTDPGAMLSTVHELDDGGHIRLRLTRPSDGPRVRVFLDGLSEESRRARFGDSKPDEHDLTFYDPRRRLVVAAAMPCAGTEQIVGVADVELHPGRLAELGVAVLDESRRRGVGMLLAEAVASLAYQRGATHAKTVIRDENPAMHALLDRLGPTVRTVEDGDCVAYTRLLSQSRRAA